MLRISLGFEFHAIIHVTPLQNLVLVVEDFYRDQTMPAMRQIMSNDA